MATYYYLVCDKCHEKAGVTKSGDPDDGPARSLDDEGLLPTFVVRHRSCGSLRVINDGGLDDGLGYSDIEIKEGNQ